MSGAQVVAKLLLSLPLLVLLVLIWRSDLDVHRLRAGGRALRAWLALHEPDGVYQGGRMVGRVEGVDVHEAERVVTFRAIRQTAPMAVGRPFEFRGWSLQPKAIERLEPAAPETGRVLQGVTCEILGPP